MGRGESLWGREDDKAGREDGKGAARGWHRDRERDCVM